jgi:GntR family transcriptional regulator
MRGEDDFQGLGPAAEGVRRRILAEIADGTLAPGQRLGAERTLTGHYGVSRSTLRSALDALESAGAVHRSLGRHGGTFVAARRVERDLTSMAGLPAYLQRQGFEAGARVLSTTTREANEEEAGALRLELGAVLFEIVRVRLADGEPISLESASFPAERFPALLEQPLGGSLYALLQAAYGLTPGEAIERIEVVGASATAARLLGIRRSTLLVSVHRISHDHEGRPFEHSHDLFRGDRVRIVVRAQAQASAPTLVDGLAGPTTEKSSPN